MTLRDKIAQTICETRAVDNWLVQGSDYELADAILAVIREGVKPLEWSQWGNEWDANNPVCGTFTVKIDGHSGFYLFTSDGVRATDFYGSVEDRSTPEDCMKQAFLIVQRRILSALGIDQ